LINCDEATELSPSPITDWAISDGTREVVGASIMVEVGATVMLRPGAEASLDGSIDEATRGDTVFVTRLWTTGIVGFNSGVKTSETLRV
jgi:hypothetical protein